MATYVSPRLVLRLAAVFSFLASGVWSVTEEEMQLDCSEEALMTCSYPSRVDQIRFASKKEDLDELCPDLHTGLRCIDAYTRQCLEPAMRSHFNQLYTGTSMVIQEICQDGPYQKEFLRHAPCLELMKKNYEVCARDYQHKMKGLSTDPKKGGDESQVANICCSLHEYLTCSKTTVLKTCGKETAAFTEGFLDKMAYSLMETHCQKYSTGSQACLELNASNFLQRSILLLPLAVLLHFFLI